MFLKWPGLDIGRAEKLLTGPHLDVTWVIPQLIVISYRVPALLIKLELEWHVPSLRMVTFERVNTLHSISLLKGIYPYNDT